MPLAALDTQNLLYYGMVIAVLAVSLSLHELAHAGVALLCGDTTARDQGRLTADPRAHVDPVMTLLLPAALLLVSGGRMFFAGARPVPVSYHRLRHPARDMMLVALAGPLSNFLIAIVLMIGLRAAESTGYFQPNDLGYKVLYYSVLFNVLLAAFNMLPIPPLDGSRVVAYFLPAPLRDSYRALETYGMLILFGLLMTGVIGRFVLPATMFLFGVVERITAPLF